MTQHPGRSVRVSQYPSLQHLDDSTEAMREVLNAHLEQLAEFYHHTGRPVTLIGHSLGAYFSMELMKLVPDWIQRAIFVHPFLRRPHPIGRITLGAVAPLSKYKKLQNVFLRSRKGFEYFFSDLSFVTDEEILKSFHLARHESATIARDRSPIDIKTRFRDKIRVFYTPKDVWCPSSVVANLGQQVSVHECPEPHDFVTNEKHRRSLFSRIISTEETSTNF